MTRNDQPKQLVAEFKRLCRFLWFLVFLSHRLGTAILPPLLIRPFREALVCILLLTPHMVIPPPKLHYIGKLLLNMLRYGETRAAQDIRHCPKLSQIYLHSFLFSLSHPQTQSRMRLLCKLLPRILQCPWHQNPLRSS